jgi:hypothetical protein
VGQPFRLSISLLGDSDTYQHLRMTSPHIQHTFIGCHATHSVNIRPAVKETGKQRNSDLSRALQHLQGSLLCSRRYNFNKQRSNLFCFKQKIYISFNDHLCSLFALLGSYWSLCRAHLPGSNGVRLTALVPRELQMAGQSFLVGGLDFRLLFSMKEKQGCESN